MMNSLEVVKNLGFCNIWEYKPGYTPSRGTCGIYLVIDRVSELAYVGASTNCQKRFRSHVSAARSGHLRTPFAQLPALPCLEGYLLEETCQLNSREKFWIAYMENLGLTLLNKKLGGYCDYKTG